MKSSMNIRSGVELAVRGLGQVEREAPPTGRRRGAPNEQNTLYDEKPKAVQGGRSGNFRKKASLQLTRSTWILPLAVRAGERFLAQGLPSLPKVVPPGAPNWKR
ncbi:hypothetical protein J7T55_011636 [Diaporthe amygdali]|uniref:uncharacterized protein n=1 Tax=Phomopsis amygdali TaxID=1214568 RepID=UPI0022FEF87C|nr:uncharacterized protein J7T55_011636 [Diaporthe amygdali]KAJ0123172.1 hypothetical protein J7T55_011636 [Diaporthe amygdali]